MVIIVKRKTNRGEGEEAANQKLNHDDKFTAIITPWLK